VQIAEALRSALPRSGDLLARYGGEEFAVILPGTDLDGARTVAANMQEAVNALKIRNETAIGLYASISVGISTYVFPELGSASLLVETSDRALYQAKERGRNRIEFMTMPLFTNT
jgi:diguanylate cyclase (GGDEF)-like protein